MKLKCICKRILATACGLTVLLSSLGGAALASTTVSETPSVVDAIGLVSYRDSVLTAIEAAEAVYDTLSDEEKATVDAARAEYDRLAILARDIQKIHNIDLSVNWSVSNNTLERVDSTDAARPGQHLVITPTDTASRWSIWYSKLELDISSCDFDNLYFGMDVKRTGGNDSGGVNFTLINNGSQKMNAWWYYSETGMTDGAWTFVTKDFTNTQNPSGWAYWTKGTYDSEQTIYQLEIYQSRNAATEIEVSSMGIYDKSIDITAQVEQANAVVDRIAAITDASQTDAIAAARAAYDALSDNAKALVVNEPALVALEGNTSDVLGSGFTFTPNQRYDMVKALDVMPNTFEATIRLPKTSGRAGVIVGNYLNGVSVNFEIGDKGVPRLYIVTAGSKVNDCQFSEVDVRTGEWVHLTIVRDVQAKQFHCYVDGEFKQTVSMEHTVDAVCNFPMVLGGDLRLDNSQYFKGEIRSVALYSDMRSADEIKADVTAPGKDDLVVHYDLSDLESGVKNVSDLSGNGYDAKKQAISTKIWLDEGPTIEDYAYSFAVVGDTQILAEYYPEKFDTLYDWIVDNAESKKMEYVLGMGDITNKDTAAEWQLAKENISKLNSVVPYSLCIGNHDSSAQMNRYFSAEEYPDQVYSYNGKMESTWRELRVGQVSYLIFTLEYGASDAVLNWASEIIEAHPYHNVIITTHGYLYKDGERISTVDQGIPSNVNNGEYIWNSLISKHENIVLVLSGHVLSDYVVVSRDKGNNGNTVTQMLINPQGTDMERGGVGMVAMFYFSEDGRQVQVEYYSTAKEQWFLEKNQFAIELDTVAPPQAEDVIDAIAALPETITLEHEEAVKAARAICDMLTDEQKALVTNLTKLTEAEQTILELKEDPSGAIAAIDAIGQVSYRPSVADAIDAAEKLYNSLNDTAKAEVTNADALIAARAEYERLASVAKDLQIIWQADTSTLEGISYDGGELQLEDIDDTDEHAGEHWVMYPSGDAWSVWAATDLDISEYDFDQLKLGFSVRRTDSDDGANGLFTLDLCNGANERMVMSSWYAQCGATNGEWTYMEYYFNQFEDPNSGLNPWPTWNAEDWNSESPITLVRFAQNSSAAEMIEIDRLAIYNEGIDIDTLAAEANAVVDKIAAIGEVTSAEQEAAVNAARDAYDALSEIQQELVVNADALQAMEIAVRQLKAENVIAAIDAIGEVTEGNYAQKADAIAAAREAYDNYYNKYNDETLITNLNVLIAAEEAYKNFLPVETYVLGDINNDGDINASDALLALQHSVKLITLEGDKAKAADVTKEGEINASDALKILQYSVNLITEF